MAVCLFVVMVLALLVLASSASASVLSERGVNYEIWDNQDGTFTWHNAPQWIWDGDSYKPYIYEDLYASDGYYQVQTGRIGMRIYDYYATFYNPDMSEVRLYDERWEVQKWKTTGKGGWEDLGTQSGTPTFDVVTNSSGVFITKIFNSWAGELQIEYIFIPGNPLKHTVTFTSAIEGNETIQVVQQWAGIAGNKVRHQHAETEIVTATTINSSYFQFGSAANDYMIFENQWKMCYDEYGNPLTEHNLKPVEIDVHAQGMKANFIFGDWVLAQDESLEIDPDTATLDDPMEDGYIDTNFVEYIWDKTGQSIDFLYYMPPRYRRGYVEWPIGSLSGTITKVEFRYHGKANPSTDNCYIYAMAYQPSVQSDDNAGKQVIFDDAGDGTAYLDNDATFPEVGMGKDVGGASGPAWDTDPKTDLQAAVDASRSWFALGFKSSEATADDFGGFYSEDKTDGANPKPTLYVEYVLPEPPTPTNLQNSTYNFFVNYTWQAGTGNATDSYNVSWNSTWYNATTDLYMNKTVGTHGWANISVWAYNSTSTGTLSTGNISDNVQVPNNAPSIPTLLAPTNGTYTNDNTTFFNWTCTDADGDTVYYHLQIDDEIAFASPYTYENTSVVQSNYTATAALSDGKYYWRVRGNDTYENGSWATHFNFTVDTTDPLITLDGNILNTTSYFKNSIKVNYTLTEINQNRTWYNVSNSTAVVVANTTITANTTFEVLADGEYTLVVYADDKAGNENSTSITFKADITAPAISNMNVSAASVLVGNPVTITCEVNDTYAGVDLDGVSVRVENSKGVVSNYSMVHGTGDNYSYEYNYTGASGTYLLKYFYAYDNATGSDGNLAAEASELYFNAISYTGGEAGGGGAPAPAPTPMPDRNETLVDIIVKKPMHLLEKVLQRIYPFYTFPPQEKIYEFPGADKPLAECLASEGAECVIDEADNHTFYVMWAPQTDDFFIKEMVINITVYDVDDYRDVAVLQLTAINLGAYLPIRPFKVGTPEWLAVFFKLEEDIEGVKWITGIRWLWIFIASSFILSAVGWKREAIIESSDLGAKRIRGFAKRGWK